MSADPRQVQLCSEVRFRPPLSWPGVLRPGPDRHILQRDGGGRPELHVAQLQIRGSLPATAQAATLPKHSHRVPQARPEYVPHHAQLQQQQKHSRATVVCVHSQAGVHRGRQSMHHLHRRPLRDTREVCYPSQNVQKKKKNSLESESTWTRLTKTLIQKGWQETLKKGNEKSVRDIFLFCFRRHWFLRQSCVCVCAVFTCVACQWCIYVHLFLTDPYPIIPSGGGKSIWVKTVSVVCWFIGSHGICARRIPTKDLHGTQKNVI